MQHNIFTFRRAETLFKKQVKPSRLDGDLPIDGFEKVSVHISVKKWLALIINMYLGQHRLCAMCQLVQESAKKVKYQVTEYQVIPRPPPREVKILSA